MNTNYPTWFKKHGKTLKNEKTTNIYIYIYLRSSCWGSQSESAPDWPTQRVESRLWDFPSWSWTPFPESNSKHKTIKSKDIRLRGKRKLFPLFGRASNGPSWQPSLGQDHLRHHLQQHLCGLSCAGEQMDPTREWVLKYSIGCVIMFLIKQGAWFRVFFLFIRLIFKQLTLCLQGSTEAKWIPQCQEPKAFMVSEQYSHHLIVFRI